MTDSVSYLVLNKIGLYPPRFMGVSYKCKCLEEEKIKTDIIFLCPKPKMIIKIIIPYLVDKIDNICSKKKSLNLCYFWEKLSVWLEKYYQEVNILWKENWQNGRSLSQVSQLDSTRIAPESQFEHHPVPIYALTMCEVRRCTNREL